MNVNGEELLDERSIMELCGTLQIPKIIEVRECCEVICDVKKLHNTSNSFEIIERPNGEILQKELKKRRNKNGSTT